MDNFISVEDNLPEEKVLCVAKMGDREVHAHRWMGVWHWQSIDTKLTAGWILDWRGEITHWRIEHE